MADFLKRTMYLGYYLKEMDRDRFRLLSTYAARHRGISRAAIYADVLRSVYRHNVSPLDYFHFRFFEQDDAGRGSWAGTGHMYEYQRVMNPPRSREVLENKIRFMERFRCFVRRPIASLAVLRTDASAAHAILNDSSGLVVLKDATGQCGREVEVRETTGLTPAELVRVMIDGGFDLAEGYVTQHSQLMALSPSGLNTVRIFTQLSTDGAVDLLGVRLRVSVNSRIDNLAAGNMAAAVDPETGIVTGPGVYSDPFRPEQRSHPVTGTAVVGFALPFWPEVLAMVTEAAQMVPENRSVGWDVAITEAGPELIEGNHNWCKLLWQLPVQQGLKHMLDSYR